MIACQLGYLDIVNEFLLRMIKVKKESDNHELEISLDIRAKVDV